MATFFYDRTLPAPRFTSGNSISWTSLGIGTGWPALARIPTEYVDGGGDAFLVQIFLQRSSTNASVRINLDSNSSGSGGQAGPDFISFVETRGLIRLSYSGRSYVLDLNDASLDDETEPYAWQWNDAEDIAFMRDLVNAVHADSTIPVTIELAVPDGTLVMRASLGNPQGVRKRVGEAEGLSVGASVGNPKATIHGEAEGVTVRATTGRPRGYYPSVAAQGFTVQASQRQVAGFRRQFAYAEFLHIEEFGVRDRTRSGGSVWEWNGRNVMPPFPVGDNTAITVLRLRSDQFRVTGTSNTLAGLGADFIRHGDLILYSPSAGEFHITPDVGRFDSAGRIRLAGDEWDAWWTAFSADAANELTVEWFFHGLEPVVSVGRPLGVKDPTKYGLPIPIAAEQAVGRPVITVIGEGTGIAAEMAVGRPRGFIPKVAAQPIAQEAAVGQPHAFAHAEFILQEAAVGRPIARVKRAVQAVAQEAAVGRPAAILYGVPGSTTAGETVTESHNFGRYTLIRPDANSTWQFNSNLTLPTPIMTATASPIVQAHVRANQVRFIQTGGQNPGFSDAFNTRGRLTLTRVGAQSFTITGPNFDHLGRMDPSGLDGYSEWWTAFSIGGTLSQLEVTWELDVAGFIPFLAAEAAVGMPEGRTQIVGEGMPIAQEAATGRPHAFAHAEFILEEAAVGRPGVSTTRAVRPIAQEAATSRPHVLAHGSGIAAELAVGRPRSRTTRATLPIAQEAATSRPHAFAHAEFILAEQAVGRPIAQVKRAVQAIAQEAATGQPHAYAHAEFILEEAVVGRPGVSTSRAVQAIAQEIVINKPDGVKKRFAVAERINVSVSVGRPRGYLPAVAAEAIVTGVRVGRPRAIVTRATLPIAQVAAVGRPQPYAHGAGVIAEQSVGRPRGYIPAVAAMPVAQESATGRPHAFAHAEFILEVAAVGRPGVATSRASRPIAQEATTGRPHALAHGSAVAQAAAVGRPRSYIPAVAAMPLAAEQAVGRPRGVTQARTRPAVAEQVTGRPGVSTSRGARAIAQVAAVGRPHSPAHGSAVAAEQVTGRPGVSTTRGVRAIAAEQAVSMPIGERRRIAYGMPLVAEQVAGRPGVSTTRGVQPVIAEQVTRRPAAVLFIEALPVVGVAETGRPRGYLPSVAAHALTEESVVGLALGERVRTSPAFPISMECAVGRPLGYFQALGTALAAEFSSGRPQRYYPRRYAETGDVAVAGVETSVSVRGTTSRVDVAA